MDDLTKEQRAKNMRNIHSSHTKPEDLVGKYLFSKGLRYRRNDKRYPGKPDFVLPKYRTIVFVHGCFWHQHQGCRYSSIPESNKEYWIPKLKRNAERDQESISALTDTGWKVIVVWECSLKSKHREETLKQLLDDIIGKNDLH